MKYYQPGNPAILVKVNRELLEGAANCLKLHYFTDPESVFRELGVSVNNAFRNFSATQIAEAVAEAKKAGSESVVLESVPFETPEEERIQTQPPVEPPPPSTPSKKETAAGSGPKKPS